MSRKVFINLHVNDLQKSIAFYEALGFKMNPHFTDETGSCIVISEEIYVMLLTPAKFQSFTPKSICDARKQAEVMVALSCENREEVDELAKKALASGGTENMPATDYGFMYSQSFTDLDGHIWEPFWMDPSAVPPQE